MFYSTAFLVAALVTLIVLMIALSVKKHLHFFHSPKGQRHVGADNALRIGGVAILCGFLSAVIYDANLVLDYKTVIFLAGLVCVVTIGVIDDIWSLSWRKQLCAQVAVAAAIFFGGIKIGFIAAPFGMVSFLSGPMIIVGLIITVLWIVSIINVLNWSDGIDGLSGGVTLIAAGTLFLLALRPEVGQPPFAIIAASLFGAVLAFTVVNAVTGDVIAGSSGSYLMGFVIAVLAIFAGAKIGTALLVLVVPLMDACSVIFARVREGESIFQPDRRHVHHNLLQCGWQKWHILIFYYTMTFAGACIALATQSMGKLLLFLIYGSFLLVVISMITHIAIRKPIN